MIQVSSRSRSSVIWRGSVFAAVHGKYEGWQNQDLELVAGIEQIFDAPFVQINAEIRVLQVETETESA